MAKTQSAAKSATKTPAIVKATPPAAPKAPKAPPKGTHQVAAGTVVGPKGKKLVEDKANAPAEVTQEQREGERRQQQANAVMQFTQTQLDTAAAHAPALVEDKMAAFKAAQAKLAAEMGITLAPDAPAAAPKATKVQQNNITRPAAGTKTGLVWATADAISAAQNGHPASIAQVTEKLKGMNSFTVKTQFARWRAFNGIKGRLPVIKPVMQEGNYPGIPLVK